MISKKSQTRKGQRQPALSTLAKLWRRAVLKKSKNTCAICGGVRTDAQLEAHHVIHRSQSGLLKWNVDNGVAVCKGSCHSEAHRAWGAVKIAKSLCDIYLNLVELDRQTLKTHLAETGKTRAEWLKEQYLELTDYLKEAE